MATVLPLRFLLLYHFIQSLACGTRAAPKVRCVKNPIFDFLQNGGVVVLALAMIFAHAAVNRVSDACK